MNPADHFLFQKFPIQKEETISIGKVPVPYHIYNGLALFIGGSANYDAVAQLLQQEDLVPIKTRDNRAVVGIWIADFTEASLNPHHELQFSIFVTKSAIEPLDNHPFAAMYAMLNPEIKMMCHGLWNNTDTVVAYNRELLGLNALKSESKIQKINNRVAFSISEAHTQAPILAGSVGLQPSLSATFSFMSGLGWRQSLKLMRAPYLGMDVVNPKSPTFSENMLAKAFAYSSKNTLHYFLSSDKLYIQHPIYQFIDFQPKMIERMNDFKFVYLHPEKWNTLTL